MFQRFHEMRERREDGFTLIELLVVILIVAILAAVAIPVFLRQREKGYVDQSESSLKNAATAAESFATGNNGSYATLDLAALQAEGFKSTASTVVSEVFGDADSFCITVNHDNLTDNYYYTNADTDPEAGHPAVGDCTDADGV